MSSISCNPPKKRPGTFDEYTNPHKKHCVKKMYSAIRVTKVVSRDHKRLRPSSLLPKESYSSTPAFQHGAKGDIHIFETERGWFFKNDKGTDITLSIPESIRNNLERVFANHISGTREDDRQFGCILMSLALLIRSKNTDTHTAIIDQFTTAQSMAGVFNISNDLKEKKADPMPMLIIIGIQAYEALMREQQK